MNLYHYTRVDDWEEIQGGTYLSGGLPGLGPSRRIGKEYETAYIQRAIFMLLEPIPLSWSDNKYFPKVWEKLQSQTGSLLLEINPGNTDDYSVLDWGHMEGHLSNNPEYFKMYGKNIPQKYMKKNRIDAEKAYIESKIPLTVFLGNASLREEYSVPEVIKQSPISISEISISKIQPKLLDSQGKPMNDFARRTINGIPELKKLLSL